MFLSLRQIRLHRSYTPRERTQTAPLQDRTLVHTKYLINYMCSKIIKINDIYLSLISHEKIPGFSALYSSILLSTSGVATRGLLPPMTPGRMLPVSWYLLRILDTHPWDTLSCLDMEHGRTPWAAISTIFSLTWLGRGLPLMNIPPSWFTRPCPVEQTSATDNAFTLTNLFYVTQHAHATTYFTYCNVCTYCNYKSILYSKNCLFHLAGRESKFILYKPAILIRTIKQNGI